MVLLVHILFATVLMLFVHCCIHSGITCHTNASREHPEMAGNHWQTAAGLYTGSGG